MHFSSQEVAHIPAVEIPGMIKPDRNTKLRGSKIECIILQFALRSLGACKPPREIPGSLWHLRDKVATAEGNGQMALWSALGPSNHHREWGKRLGI